MHFKSSIQQREFRELTKKNPPLAMILLELNFGCLKYFGKPICVTEVHRSEKANDQIYRANTAGIGTHKKKRTTAHTVWAAVDVRSFDFSEPQRKRIIAFLKQFDRWNSWGLMTDSKTVLLHAEGDHGLHFHVQYTGPRPPPVKFDWDENDQRRVDVNSRVG
jgi:hypothetical protein